jgi:hypothetical protein
MMTRILARSESHDLQPGVCETVPDERGGSTEGSREVVIEFLHDVPPPIPIRGVVHRPGCRAVRAPDDTDRRAGADSAG